MSYRNSDLGTINLLLAQVITTPGASEMDVILIFLFLFSNMALNSSQLLYLIVNQRKKWSN